MLGYFREQHALLNISGARATDARGFPRLFRFGPWRTVSVVSGNSITPLRFGFRQAAYLAPLRTGFGSGHRHLYYAPVLNDLVDRGPAFFATTRTKPSFKRRSRLLKPDAPAV